MPYTYRTRILHSILSVVFILFLAFIVVSAILRQVYGVALIVGLFAGISTFVQLRKHKAEITLTEETISAKLEKSSFQTFWHEILMAHRVKQRDAIDFVELATANDVFRIDLRLFDGNQIWNHIQAKVPAEALQKEAYKRLPSYQKWVEEGERLVKDTTIHLQASYSWRLKMIMFLVFIIFAFIGIFGIFILNNTELWPSTWLCFGPLIVFGLWCFLETMFTSLEMSSEKIKAINLWRRKTINWAEVQYIKYDRRKQRLLFCGQNNCVGVIKPQQWDGKDKEKMLRMLDAQVEHLGIEFQT